MDNINDWKKAGSIVAKVLDYARTIVKKGASVKDVADALDKKIVELGGLPAFPSQLSLNEVAAHFCPDIEDSLVFGSQLVKVDVGVRVNGCIGDAAITIDLSGEHRDLVRAAEQARDEALKMIKPGVKVCEIGKVIHEVIKSFGFTPIRNLSGHGLEEGIIHAGPTVPNYDDGNTFKLEEGMVVAVEPFATSGAGIVYESEKAGVFSLVQKKPVRSPYAREILKVIEAEYEEFPFALRWLEKDFGKGKTALAMKELLNLGVVRSYPALIEKNKQPVAQAEHTVIVLKEPIVTTRI